ncbi:MAG: hypothetical protein QOI24_2937 [Acidobacteriota bacterium]|nr:hypothetical protein [Acidobacteriota bacterium]
MNILHVVPTYLPARRYGGPIYAVHGLAKALAARGHRVDVFTTNVDGNGVSDVPLATRVDLDGVGVHYFASSFRRLYWSAGLRNALDERVARYDVVHLHSIFLHPTAAAARAAKRSGTPYVIAPRGMLVPELIRGRSRITKSLWLRFVEERNFAGAAGIHFTSERERADAERTGMPLPSPFIVPNGIDVPPPLNRSRNEREILALGRVSWKKGLDRLIAALPHIDDATLTIAGNDEEELTPRLREQARTLGVEQRITFLGDVGGDAKYELLAGAAVVAMPSINENFGNVVLEAMSMETPVVVTPEVGLADEVRRADAGVVVNGEPHALAAAIDELLRDPARRAAMGARGRRAVEERFTWPRVAEQMEAAYARLRR